MKSNLFLLFSAGALALGLAGCASSAGLVAGADRTLEINRPVDPGLAFPADDGTAAILTQPGVSTPVGALDKAGVLQMLGRPEERLTPNVWIYWRYYSSDQAAENGGHDTLVVAFAQEKVVGMKLVEGDALRRQLAGRRPPRRATRL